MQYFYALCSAHGLVIITPPMVRLRVVYLLLDLRMTAIGPVRGALNVVLNVNLKNIDTARVQCMREVGKSVLEVCSRKCDSG